MKPTRSGFSALIILTRMALRRKLNKMSVAFSRKKKKKGKIAQRSRQAVHRKKTGGKILFMLFIAIFLFNGWMISNNFYMQLNREIAQEDSPDKAFTPSTFKMRVEDPDDLEKLKHAVAFILTVLSIALLIASLGSANQDLGQVEWSFQWLFTFPVDAWILFLSKVVEYAIGNIFGWFVFLPFLTVTFWTVGFSFWSILMSLFITLNILIVLASIQLVVETWMRKHFNRGKLKNLQGTFTLLGLLGLFGVFFLVMSPTGVSTLLKLSQNVGEAIVWNPFGLPGLLVLGKMNTMIVFPFIILYSVTIIILTVFICQRIVRNGLITETGPYAGVRSTGLKNRKPFKSGWFKGIIGKEARLLFRDRNLMVQTLFVPMLVIGFQVVVNPGLITAMQNNFNHAAMIAFGVGAYALMFSAVHVLSVEGKSLWLLFTFPITIEKILVRKTIFWGAIASIFPLIVLIAAFTQLDSIDLKVVTNSLMVFAGLIIYSFFAAGLGALGTDPFEDNVKRKVKQSMLYLYMVLAALYSFAIYSDEVNSKAAMLVLCSILAFAIWQKVRDSAPFLLDPTQSPPRALSLIHGFGAVLVFYTMQGFLLRIFLLRTDMAPGFSLILAFVIAGAVVTLTMDIILKGIPGIGESLGLWRSKKCAGSGFLLAIREGIFFGCIGIVIGKAYIWLVEHLEFFQEIKETANIMEQVRASSMIGFIVLAVLVAPLFEEFIFRGLVFRGLRRTLSPTLSISASALIFALVHPPISMIPVFFMGLVAALSIERTKLLLTAVIVHAIYNAGIILL